MTENIFKVSEDQGKTVTVPFAELAQDGQLATKVFDIYHAEHPEFANIIVDLDGIDGTFKGYTGVLFALDRADKTRGTYVTRVNKIIAGEDPAQRESRVAGVGSSTKANIGIKRVDDHSVSLFGVGGETFAHVTADGVVETNDFLGMAYFITALLDPRKYANRLGKLRQFENGVEATPPSYTLTFVGETIDLGAGEPAQKEVIDGRIKLLGNLMKAGIVFDANEIMVLAPVMTGGGSEWLQDWVDDNYNFAEIEIEEEGDEEV